MQALLQVMAFCFNKLSRPVIRVQTDPSLFADPDPDFKNPDPDPSLVPKSSNQIFYHSSKRKYTISQQVFNVQYFDLVLEEPDQNRTKDPDFVPI